MTARNVDTDLLKELVDVVEAVVDSHQFPDFQTKADVYDALAKVQENVKPDEVVKEEVDVSE